MIIVYPFQEHARIELIEPIELLHNTVIHIFLISLIERMAKLVSLIERKICWIRRTDQTNEINELEENPKHVWRSRQFEKRPKMEIEIVFHIWIASPTGIIWF